MSSIGGFITSYLINSVWEVTLLAGTGWLVSRLLRRLGPQAEHIAWVSALVIAVVAPALPIFRHLLSLLFVSHAVSERLSITFIDAQSGGLNPGGIYILPPVVVWPLLTLYCGSFLYFVVRFAWLLHSAATLLQQANPVVLTPQEDEIWSHCKRSFSLNTARILGSSQIPGPVVLGLREPVLLVPSEFATDCTPQDLIAALAHECAHMKRHDFQKNLFYEAISLIVAFHPVIWILKSRIAQTREMACDGMVTEKLVDARSYAHSLLRLATMVAITARISTAHAIGIFDANILEKRIMMMNIKKQHVSRALKYGLTIPAILLLLSVAVVGSAMAMVIEPQSSSQTAGQAAPYGHVYKVGKDVSAPVPVKAIEAEFPKSGHNIKAPFQALVLVGLIVDADGLPRNVHIARSYRPDFDAEAIKAARQYRFNPAKRLGKPVAVSLTIEVNFKLF